jgi:hypothetical protein
MSQFSTSINFRKEMNRGTVEGKQREIHRAEGECITKGIGKARQEN